MDVKYLRNSQNEDPFFSFRDMFIEHRGEGEESMPPVTYVKTAKEAAKAAKVGSEMRHGHLTGASVDVLVVLKMYLFQPFLKPPSDLGWMIVRNLWISHISPSFDAFWTHFTLPVRSVRSCKRSWTGCVK